MAPGSPPSGPGRDAGSDAKGRAVCGRSPGAQAGSPTVAIKASDAVRVSPVARSVSPALPHRPPTRPGTGVSSQLRNDAPAPSRALPGDSDMPGTDTCQPSSVPKESLRNSEHRHAHTTGSHRHFLLQAGSVARQGPRSRECGAVGEPQGSAVTPEQQSNVPVESPGPQPGPARARSSCLRLWMSL